MAAFRISSSVFLQTPPLMMILISVGWRVSFSGDDGNTYSVESLVRVSVCTATEIRGEHRGPPGAEKAETGRKGQEVPPGKELWGMEFHVVFFITNLLPPESRIYVIPAETWSCLKCFQDLAQHIFN
jgi:hypothetical protein